MTEKRYRKVLGLIKDNQADDDGLLDLGDIEDRLNEQHETIQRLEAQLSHLEYRFTEYRNKVGKND